MPLPNGDFHQPYRLFDRNDFKKNYKKAIELVRDGLPAQDACNLVFGLASHKTYHQWFNWAIEDMEAGFDETESNLIKLFIGLARADAELHSRLARKAVQLATDRENVQMLQFLLKTRYKYSERNISEVEINTDDTPIVFNVIDMEEDEEE